jgi:ABC-type proline/glycine betaine transport system permease subunit
MQTMPSLAYLVPVIVLFGIGQVPGAIATIIFALPPGVRFTELGIRGVDTETVEAAKEGIVCIKSRIGLMMAENRFDLAAQIPNGIARIRARMTATTTKARLGLRQLESGPVCPHRFLSGEIHGPVEQHHANPRFSGPS